MNSAVHIHRHVGERAEDKDFARSLRVEVILPSLAAKKEVTLDFSNVRMATQSFIHAAVSEPVRKFGDDALALLEFRQCNKAIKAVISTVVEYSILFGRGELRESLGHAEIPQADDLAKVRLIIDSIALGAMSRASIKARTGFTMRHVDYRIASARILGFIGAEDYSLTEVGNRLLSLEPTSDAERHLFLNAVEESKVYRIVVPDLLEIPAPSRDEIGRRIQSHTSLAPATARRRANTLLAWRRYIGSPQLSFWNLAELP